LRKSICPACGRRTAPGAAPIGGSSRRRRAPSCSSRNTPNRTTRGAAQTTKRRNRRAAGHTGGQLAAVWHAAHDDGVALYPMEVIQTPKQVTIITEAFSEVRRVYMNQPQMPIDEVPPGYYGHSVGRWDGTTFVIDTVGIKESVPSYQMMPHSNQMRITERIRLVTPDVLHDQITIEDPVALEKPVVYTLAFRRMPNYKMVEFVCENNREYVDEKGAVKMRLRDKYNAECRLQNAECAK
jgi:hypothetical protein